MARAGPSKAARRPSAAFHATGRGTTRSRGGRAPKASRAGVTAARRRFEAHAEHRGQHAIEPRASCGSRSRNALDRVEHRVLVADERQVVVAGQLDEPRPGIRAAT